MFHDLSPKRFPLEDNKKALSLSTLIIITPLFPPLNRIRLRFYFLTTLTLPLTLASSRSEWKGRVDIPALPRNGVRSYRS
jgi:hypothetical protein